MKNTMKKSLSLLLAIMLIASALLLSGCRQQDKLVIEEPETSANSTQGKPGETQPSQGAPNNTAEELVVKVSDNCIIIKTTVESIGDATDMLLIDYMSSLKEDGKLEFTIDNGMVNSINGVANPADYSSCWMLYTSDEDNANSAWGIVEYKGIEYGSAVAGAETLKIKADQLYIWVYKSFS